MPNPLRRLILLDRGTNHPTHLRCPIPCDDLSCWIAVLTTPHTYDAQSPVGAALVAARRGLGRGNHICVATTPPQGAHKRRPYRWPPAGVGTPLQVAADRMFGVQ